METDFIKHLRSTRSLFQLFGTVPKTQSHTRQNGLEYSMIKGEENVDHRYTWNKVKSVMGTKKVGTFGHV